MIVKQLSDIQLLTVTFEENHQLIEINSASRQKSGSPSSGVRHC